MFPRFKKAHFQVRFPFATLHLTDQEMPVAVRINGWSPFIPGDADNSSLPVGGFEYSFRNTGTTKVETFFSFCSVNFMKKGEGVNSIQPISNRFILSQKGDLKNPHYQGDFAIFADNSTTVVDHCMFRGGWWDPLTMAWNTIERSGIKGAARLKRMPRVPPYTCH